MSDDLVTLAADLAKDLEEQWLQNHVDHCADGWPHDSYCLWPQPTSLARYKSLVGEL